MRQQMIQLARHIQFLTNFVIQRKYLNLMKKFAKKIEIWMTSSFHVPELLNITLLLIFLRVHRDWALKSRQLKIAICSSINPFRNKSKQGETN